jgi:hypothetical protein
MPTWKVLFIMLFGFVCLGLALATVIVPLSMVDSGYRWVWLAGLLLGTLCMSTLFALYLRSADRASANGSRRRE